MIRFIILAALSAALVRAMVHFGALDHPGARSSHTMPTPKGGGVGIVAAFLVGCLWAGPDARMLGLLGAATLLAAISYYDDLYNWPFRIKLAAQCAAACAAILCGVVWHSADLPGLGPIKLGVWGAPLTLGWLLLVTNAINFIDGLNGLASGSVALACVLLLLLAPGGSFLPAACLALAAGIAGFLPFNFPHARIFMGDVGSQFCGFIVACLGVLATQHGPILLMPLLLAGIVSDVLFTLARRFLAGDRLTQAHRSHLYQVAHRAGLPAWAITLIYWCFVLWSGGLFALQEAQAPLGLPALIALMVLPEALWLILVWHISRHAKLGRW